VYAVLIRAAGGAVAAVILVQLLMPALNFLAAVARQSPASGEFPILDAVFAVQTEANLVLVALLGAAFTVLYRAVVEADLA
jgi:hypothetical protein